MLSTKPITMTSSESQSETVSNRREKRLRIMRKTTTIALAATLIALGGCASAEKTPMALTNGDAGTSAAPVIRVPEPTPAPVAIPVATTTDPVTVNGSFIDAAAILDKLDDIGCKLTALEIRAVKRGGHFSASCKISDPLNAKIDDL